jgi:Fe-S-cluster containining protein
MSKKQFSLEEFKNPGKIVNYRDCLACKRCCVFLKKYPGGAPILTEKELNKLNHQEKSKLLYKKIGNFTYRVIFKNKNCLRCAFLDNKKYLCQIYGEHPFDCRFFPFMLVKNKRNQKIALVYDKNCLGIKKNSQGLEFKNYLKQLLKFLSSIKAKSFFEKYPELVLEEKNLGKYNLCCVRVLPWIIEKTKQKC